MNIWEQIAHLVEVNYGGFVNWDERFFECPECGESIYECDWDSTDLFDGRDYYICPVCESVIN